jgi:hypothetical protein
MRRALLFLVLCGVLLTPGFGAQDPPGGPPVALAVKIEGQPNPNYVAGKVAYLHIQAVSRSGMPSPINGDAVVVKTTDPRNRLNGREVGFVNGKIVLKLQWFTPSPQGGHTIEAASKSGLKGSVSGMRVDPLPKGTKLSVEDPKPWARYVWSGGMFRLLVKATDENDDPVEHVAVSLKLSKGARVFPHDYYTEDDTGIASGVIFPPEFICPGDEGGGGTVNGDAPLKLQAFIDVNGNGDIDDGEPIVEPPPPDLVSACPQVLLPTALELLKILEKGGTLEPPPPPGDDVIVVGVASAGSGAGKGKALGKNKPETLTDRELAKIRAARRFLEDEVIGFVNSGKWNGEFSQVRKRVEHLAKFLKDVAAAEPVVQRLECAAKLLQGNPDVKAIRLSIEGPGRRSRFPVGGTATVFVALFGKGRGALERSAFAECTRPTLSRVDVTGPGEAFALDPKALSHGFRCTGVGAVDLAETILFEPDDVVVIGNGNGVAAAGVPGLTEALTFRLLHNISVLQSPVRFDLDVDANDSLDDDVDGAAKYLPGERGGTKALNPERAEFNKIKFQAQRMKLIVEEGTRGALVDYKFVRFTLVTVTSHPGYCSNKSDDAVEGEGNEKDYSFAAANDGEGTVTVPIRVVRGGRKGIADFFCKDYGAYCEVRAELLRREDDPGPVVAAPNPLKIPQDESGDRIADRYQDEQIARWKEQYGEDKDRAFFAPDTDNEKEDPDKEGEGFLKHKEGSQGDKLTVLEEYRGFVLDGGGFDTNGRGGHSGGHLRLDAARKEILCEIDTTSDIEAASLVGFTLKQVAEGASKVWSTKAGVFMYFAFDEDGVRLEAGVLNTPAGMMATAEARRNERLRTNFTHVIFANSSRFSNSGELTFGHVGGPFGTGRAENANQICTFMFLSDAKAFFDRAPERIRRELDLGEFSMTGLAHGLMHIMIQPERRDGRPWDQEEHLVVTRENVAELMRANNTNLNKRIETVQVGPANAGEINISGNQSITK